MVMSFYRRANHHRHDPPFAGQVGSPNVCYDISCRTHNCYMNLNNIWIVKALHRRANHHW